MFPAFLFAILPLLPPPKEVSLFAHVYKQLPIFAFIAKVVQIAHSHICISEIFQLQFAKIASKAEEQLIKAVRQKK